jgi:hypothetical protein
MILYYRLMTKWSGLGDSTELSRMGLSQCASLWMSNLALGWLGYDLLSVLHSSTHPHNPTPSNGRVEGVQIGQHINIAIALMAN